MTEPRTTPKGIDEQLAAASWPQDVAAANPAHCAGGGLALSYYPFVPLPPGSTGRRKLTKAALMAAPISLPTLVQQPEIVAKVNRRLSIVNEVDGEVGANLRRAHALRPAVFRAQFGVEKDGGT